MAESKPAHTSTKSGENCDENHDDESYVQINHVQNITAPFSGMKIFLLTSYATGRRM